MVSFCLSDLKHLSDLKPNITTLFCWVVNHLSKTTLFWSMMDINDVVSICFTRKKKNQDQMKSFGLSLKRIRAAFCTTPSPQPPSARQKKRKKKKRRRRRRRRRKYLDSRGAPDWSHVLPVRRAPSTPEDRCAEGASLGLKRGADSSHRVAWRLGAP